MIYRSFVLVPSLIPEDVLLTMAESIITMYQFELMTVVCYGDKENNSNKSHTDAQEQVSFKEQFRKVGQYNSSRCVPMPGC